MIQRVFIQCGKLLRLGKTVLPLVICLWLIPASASAKDTGSHRTSDQFWILWERVKYAGKECPFGTDCAQTHSYSARPLNTNNTGFIYRLFGLNAPLPEASALPPTHPDTPANHCGPKPGASDAPFDPLALPKSEKGEVLRGIDALHLDLTKLKAPPGFRPEFGADLQKAFTAVLREAGIRVIPKEALPRVPGQPVLNIYFSFSDPEDLCDYVYSVFASLSQDVLLARDLRIKVSAGVWSFSTGSAAQDHHGNEFDAILRVATAFVRDHQRVNSR